MTAAQAQDRDLERIVERVRKLLALSTSQNPHEAALAAAKAQALLFRHNLSLALVEADLEPGRGDRSAFINERFDSGGRMHWRRALLGAIARHNFCRGVSYSGTRDVGIVGEPHNVAVVKDLYAFLVREISRLADLGAAGNPDLDPEGVPAWKRSFYLGAARTIARRLAEQRRRDVADIAADPRSTALVVSKDRELEEAFRQHFPEVPPDPRAGKRQGGGARKPRDSDGYRAGVRAAQRIPLNLVIAGPGGSEERRP